MFLFSILAMKEKLAKVVQLLGKELLISLGGKILEPIDFKWSIVDEIASSKD